MDTMFSRGVRPQGRHTKVQCQVPGCEGVVYTLQPGEILGRSSMPGRRVETRNCQCNVCHHERQIKVQVKVTAA